MLKAFLSLVIVGGMTVVYAIAGYRRRKGEEDSWCGRRPIKPQRIPAWTQLKTLHLSMNHLRSLPESFGLLVGLERLYRINNELSKLPESFGQLKGLQELLLSNNKLSKLPESFGQLTGLETLGH